MPNYFRFSQSLRNKNAGLADAPLAMLVFDADARVLYRNDTVNPELLVNVVICTFRPHNQA